MLEQDLKKNEIYFETGYEDEDLTIIEIKTLFYLGKNLFSGDSNSYYFQFSENYYELGEWTREKHSEDYEILCLDEVVLESSVFTYDGLLEEISEASERYKKLEK